MGRPKAWERINVRSLDRAVFGSIIAAFRHVMLQDILLLHRKPVSRKHPRYHQTGTWAVVAGTSVLRRRRPYWFKAIRKAPTRWANQIVRLHIQGVFEREAAEEAAEVEAFEREWREAQAERRRTSAHEDMHGDCY